MADVALFHHAQGLTPGVAALADALRVAGHVVRTPDLFDGRTFPTLEDGVAHAQGIGFGALMERGARAVEGMPGEMVYIGLSLGVLPAQQLAQTRPGALGAVLLHACVPTDEFGPWPVGVPVQVHAMEADPFFVEDGDIDAARALVASVDDAELFLYPGDEHLFTDSSSPAYDRAATELVLRRVTDLLDRVADPRRA